MPYKKWICGEMIFYNHCQLFIEFELKQPAGSLVEESYR